MAQSQTHLATTIISSKRESLEETICLMYELSLDLTELNNTRNKTRNNGGRALKSCRSSCETLAKKLTRRSGRLPVLSVSICRETIDFYLQDDVKQFQIVLLLSTFKKFLPFTHFGLITGADSPPRLSMSIVDVLPEDILFKY